MLCVYFYSARPTEIEQGAESPTENVTNSGPTSFIRSRLTHLYL